MKRAIEQAAARVSDVSPSNRIDGRTSWSRCVGDPRCSSPALTAMPLPQLGWCRVLLRSWGAAQRWLTPRLSKPWSDRLLWEPGGHVPAIA